MRTTTNTGEIDESLPGWSIGDSSFQRRSNATNGWATSEEFNRDIPFIQINGTPLDGVIMESSRRNLDLNLMEGSSDIVHVRLGAQPDGEVSVTFDMPDGLAAFPSPLTFTTSNWSRSQLLTVRAEWDDDLEDETYFVRPTVRGYGFVDNNEALVPALDIDVTDGTVPSVEFSPHSVWVNEGETESYTVTLGAPPDTDVWVIPVSRRVAGGC